MILTCHVKPNSRNNEFIYDQTGHLKIKITAPPEAGKANDLLIKFLSSVFHVPQKKIEIISGHKSRKKNVKIDLPDEDVVKILNVHIKET